ncbi:hypothetical protein ACIQNU_25550 [Streptomyces sp. NPDC091292]|uniref:hypothetical protein n=1 Tax=Streptomyces sp. NPDC091292 TaxID=3365991 RepID=UPI00381638FE
MATTTDETAGATAAAKGDGQAADAAAEKADKAEKAGKASGAVGAVESADAPKAADGTDGDDGYEGAEDILGSDDADDDAEDDADGDDIAPASKPGFGVGQGAAAVVSAAIGVVSLSGGWIGTVASARESIIGQLNTAQDASVATQVQQVYGDSWATTALVGGIFAVIALIVGAAVLVRPLFGTPGPAQAPWIKSVAWAGVALGTIGLLLAVAKYTDILLGLPSTS